MVKDLRERLIEALKVDMNNALICPTYYGRYDVKVVYVPVKLLLTVCREEGLLEETVESINDSVNKGLYSLEDSVWFCVDCLNIYPTVQSIEEALAKETDRHLKERYSYCATA